MELFSRRLMLLTVPLIALTLGTLVNGYRWYGGPVDYDYRDYDFRETRDQYPGREPFELLNCSHGNNGVPMMCVPVYRCPQLRLNQRHQYCRWGTNKEESGPFEGNGLHVCCPNFRPGPQSELPNRPMDPSTLSSCGLLEKDEKNKLQTRIRGNFDRQQILGAAIGGISVTSASQSPWTVAIGQYTSNGSVDWFCGGSLLSRFTILTAAHCARRRRPEVVRVGEVDLRRDTKSGEGKGEDIRVKDIVMHPSYRPPSYYNDIAVLTLQRPVDLSRTGGARTICLPPPNSSAPSTLSSDIKNTYTGEEATLTGWGHLSFGGDRSPVLQEVTVTVFGNEECSRSYSTAAATPVTKRSYPSGIINSQLCAGDKQGKKDACQGDSGGPLVVKGKDGKHSVIGVVSSGIGCGSKQYPGVYVRVSSYTDWITSKMV